jgi:DNA gyrase subunit A
VIKKYGKERKTQLLYEDEIPEVEENEEIQDYAVMAFFSREGYFKKVSLQSWRMSTTGHKLKEGDEIVQELEVSNADELLFFSNQNQVYKMRVSDFDECKASTLGDYVATKCGMDDGETAIYMAVVKEYVGYMLFFFENGKVAKVHMESYATKTNRKKLIKAYSDKSPVCAMRYITADKEFILTSSAGRVLLFNSGAAAAKSAKDTQGVNVMTLKKGQKLVKVEDYTDGRFVKPSRYRTKTLPSAGALLSADDAGEQLKL